jgi:hypothetical protein
MRHNLVNWVYYTTYVMRRDQNSVNLQAHADNLVSSYDDLTSPPSTLMWHACIVSVYRTCLRVVETGEIVEIPFLHVRWLADDEDQTDRGRRLPRMGFHDASKLSSNVFGLFDSAWITRRVHLIAGFAHGKTRIFFRAVQLLMSILLTSKMSRIGAGDMLACNLNSVVDHKHDLTQFAALQIGTFTLATLLYCPAMQRNIAPVELVELLHQQHRSITSGSLSRRRSMGGSRRLKKSLLYPTLSRR